jgi:hypothetical protein
VIVAIADNVLGFDCECETCDGTGGFVTTQGGERCLDCCGTGTVAEVLDLEILLRNIAVAGALTFSFALGKYRMRGDRWAWAPNLTGLGVAPFWVP